jgi:putative MATE family efflux protein
VISLSASRTNDLGRDRLGPLLFRLALPVILAQLVNALYNIVDRVYIGHIGANGDLALTGLGVCFPITMFLSALAALAGQGGGPRAAIAMGEGDNERANASLGGSTALLTVLALCATVLFQIFREPLLLAFGATEETIGYASGYLAIYLWGTISVLFALGLNNFITVQGFSTVSMATVLIGAAINIVLDPVFIFLLGMGVRGAALATVLAQTVSALWVLRFLTGKRSILHIQRKYLRLDPAVLGPVVALGVSPFIMQSTESMVSISFNASLRAYGGNTAVGAMTICSSVMQVLWLPIQGLGQGGQPIISYNYGSGALDRVRKAYRLVLTCCAAYMLVVWALAEAFPGALVAIFNDDPELTAMAVWALRIYLAGLCIFWIQSACQQTFVALGQAKTSLFIALLRKVILLIPLIFILPRFLEDKVFAVLLAEPVADITAALTCGCIFLVRFPRILRRRAEELGQATVSN